MMEEAHRAFSILAVPDSKIRKESFMTATAAQPGEVTMEEDDTLKTREITFFTKEQNTSYRDQAT
jgi:ring-1,2-phenylacetyl-CoA epoxidase subunit PaaE